MLSRFTFGHRKCNVNGVFEYTSRASQQTMSSWIVPFEYLFLSHYILSVFSSGDDLLADTDKLSITDSVSTESKEEDDECVRNQC